MLCLGFEPGAVKWIVQTDPPRNDFDTHVFNVLKSIREEMYYIITLTESTTIRVD